MATHSSVLAWKIPGTGEPGGLPSVGLYRVRHDWSDLAAAAAESLNPGFVCLGPQGEPQCLWRAGAVLRVVFYSYNLYSYLSESINFKDIFCLVFGFSLFPALTILLLLLISVSVFLVDCYGCCFSEYSSTCFWFGVYTRVEVSGHKSMHTFSFIKCYHLVFQTGYTELPPFYQQCALASSSC